MNQITVSRIRPSSHSLKKGSLFADYEFDQENRTSVLWLKHNHIITADRLPTVARYCTNLRHLFLSYNCEEHEDLNYEPNYCFSQFLKKNQCYARKSHRPHRSL
jgi:hypothetical protein